MSDKHESSRADELFEMLSDFRDEKKPETAPRPEPYFDDSADEIDDVLDILSGGKAPTDGDESDIPVSIFGHLSEETDTPAPKTAPKPAPEQVGEEESSVAFSNHFTSAEGIHADPLPVEPSVEEPEEDGEDEEEGRFDRVGRVFTRISAVPKAIIYIILVLLVSAYLSYYIITIGNDVFALVTDSREVTVNIPEGATDETVSDILVENGIIEYGWVYELYMKYRGDGDSATEYISGDHTLNYDLNYSQIITSLTSRTANRKIVTVTIPEGYTVDQIIELLLEKGVGEREDYVEAINNYPYKWEFVKRLDELGYSEHRKYRLEGYLYPDTYEFYTTEDEVYVINKMLGAFSDKFWKDFTKTNSKGESYEKMMKDDYGMTFDDVIVLASLVQSEGGNVDDFYYISYVFHNRLSHPDTFPRLESDATIQYVLPDRISDSTQLDPSYDSPYNTYITKGLPPGAISNPGLDALSATLFPTKPKSSGGSEINAYFFVSNNAGKTYFASSKSGHDKNVAQVKKDNEAIANGTYEG